VADFPCRAVKARIEMAIENETAANTRADKTPTKSCGFDLNSAW